MENRDNKILLSRKGGSDEELIVECKIFENLSEFAVNLQSNTQSFQVFQRHPVLIQLLVHSM